MQSNSREVKWKGSEQKERRRRNKRSDKGRAVLFLRFSRSNMSQVKRPPWAFFGFRVFSCNALWKGFCKVFFVNAGSERMRLVWTCVAGRDSLAFIWGRICFVNSLLCCVGLDLRWCGVLCFLVVLCGVTCAVVWSDGICLVVCCVAVRCVLLCAVILFSGRERINDNCWEYISF